MDIADRDKTKAGDAAEENGASQPHDLSGAEYRMLEPGEEGYKEELADIRKKIQASIEASERGEVYTAEEVFAELRERIRKIEQQAE